MALRKNFVFLTTSERTRLASAFNAVNASGFLATLASQHSANFNSGIHWGSAFLPWHRWFLRRLEQEMQSAQPGVMIPFWDWTRPDSRNIDVEPWKSFFGGRNNTGGQFDHWTYTRSAAPHPSAHLPELLPGGTGHAIIPRLDTATFAQFRAIESSGGHGGGHNWVGGTMAGGGSPADPLFWLHHGNIDRLWAVWQRNHTAAAQYTTDPAAGDSVPAAMVPLNSPMIGGATPASMLDHRTLGYTYDTDVRLEGAWEANGRPGHLATGDATSSDFFIRDDVADTGALPSGFPHWQSPDIWVRNAPPSQTENPDDGHQSPIVNQPNHVYVRVHNRGQAAAGPVAVEAYRCLPGTGMLWPTHFQSLGSQQLPPGVGSGGSARVGPFVWTPTVVGHECLLAIVRTEADDVGSLETVHGVTIPAGTAAALDHSLLVRFDNNVGQRNVAPVLAAPGASTKMGLMIRGLEAKGQHSVLIDAAELPNDTVIRARLANRVLSSGNTDIPVSSRDARFTTLEMDGGGTGAIKDVEIGGNDSFVLTLGVDFSFKATHLRRYPVRVQQTHHNAVVGSYTIELTAVKDLEDFFFGNRRSGELHVSTCQLWPKINKARLDTFERIADAQARGYDGCRFCLPEADTG
jgi:hypothetical protein